jgi:TolA-binding protein
MTDPWTKSSTVLALGAFAITVIIFLLTTPPSFREMGLMALATVFGGSIGYVSAIRAVAMSRPKAISRSQRIQDLDDEIDNLDAEITSLRQIILVNQEESARIAYMNRSDITAQHEQIISGARTKASQLEKEVKRLKAERSRVLRLTERRWRKEAK